jgi:type VI secretion system protein ImpG
VRDDLLLYYERELTFLRQMGADFAEKYPTVAGRLVLEPSRCLDPHVERMLEGFAFLAARVHLKIDDEFPEITEALLSIVYPHYIRPIPAMSIVEMHTEPGQTVAAGLKIPKDTLLYSRKVAGFECNFRTCYDTTLWPITVAAAEWKTPDRLTPPIKSVDAVGAVRVELKALGDVLFNKLETDSLRFFLNGESNLVSALYELLCCNCVQIILRDPTPGSRVKPVTIPPDSLRPVGFDEDEGMIPYPRRSFAGYRLLTEYFTFPEKFFFLDLDNLRPALAAGFKDRVEIVFLISEFELTDRRQMLEIGVSGKTFRLGCAPIVNLFAQTAEPILLDQRKFEYHMVPDIRRPNATEIFSVDQVLSVNPQTQAVMNFETFYSFRHAGMRDKKQVFWIANRRASTKRGDEGTDMYLTLVDMSMRQVFPEEDTLTMRTTCTNRDLPSRLPFGNDEGDFWIKEGGAAVKKIVCLKKPTNALRPPVGRSALWRLISQLSLNYRSLVEEGKEGLQEILKQYTFTDSAYSEQQIKGIADMRSRKHFARVISENGITFARGVRVEMELDEEQFVGGGSYLFGSVLEHFLGMYASLNSFSQLVAKSRQRRGLIHEWPPRAGRKILM